MTPKPHDLTDLRLAPVALQLDQRLEDLGRMSPDQLVSRLELENDRPARTRAEREQDLLSSVTRLIERSGWAVSWDDRGLRLAHGLHRLVLGVPAVLTAYVAGEPADAEPALR